MAAKVPSYKPSSPYTHPSAPTLVTPRQAALAPVALAEVLGSVTAKGTEQQEKLAKGIAEIAVKDNRRRLTIAQNQAETSITRALTEIDAKYAERTDWDVWPEAWRLDAEGAIDAELAKVGDPDVNAFVKRRAFDDYAQRVRMNQTRSHRQSVSAFEATVVEGLDARAESYGQQWENPDQLSMLRARSQSLIEEWVDMGGDPAQAARMWAAWQQDAAKAYVSMRQILNPADTPADQMFQLKTLLTDLNNGEHADLRMMDVNLRAEVTQTVTTKLWNLADGERAQAMVDFDAKSRVATSENLGALEVELQVMRDMGTITSKEFRSQTSALRNSVEDNEGNIAVGINIIEAWAGNANFDHNGKGADDLMSSQLDTMVSNLGEADIDPAVLKATVAAKMAQTTINYVPRVWKQRLQNQLLNNDPGVVTEAVEWMAAIRVANTPLYVHAFDAQSRRAAGHMRRRIFFGPNPKEAIHAYQASQRKPMSADLHDFIARDLAKPGGEGKKNGYDKAIEALDDRLDDTWGPWGEPDTIPVWLQLKYMDNVRALAHTGDGSPEDVDASIEQALDELFTVAKKTTVLNGQSDEDVGVFQYNPPEIQYFTRLTTKGLVKPEDVPSVIEGKAIEDVGGWLAQRMNEDPTYKNLYSEILLHDEERGYFIDPHKIRLHQSPYGNPDEYDVELQTNKGDWTRPLNADQSPTQPFRILDSEIEAIGKELKRKRGDQQAALEKAVPLAGSMRMQRELGLRQQILSGDERPLLRQLIGSVQPSWQADTTPWTMDKYDPDLRAINDRNKRYADPDGEWVG